MHSPNPMTPCFEALYAACPICPVTPETEETQTILPCCWRTIAGKTYFEHRNIPLRLTSRIESHCCSDRSRTPPIPRTPALFTRMSIRPYRSSAETARLSALSALLTSVVTAIACPARDLIRSTVSLAPSGSMSATTTLAPSSAKSAAVARPNPLPPPVIIATLSTRRFTGIRLHPRCSQTVGRSPDCPADAACQLPKSHRERLQRAQDLWRSPDGCPKRRLPR